MASPATKRKVPAAPAPDAEPQLAAVPKPRAPHRWRFYRAGGVDQVRLDTGADIVNLGNLDLKLWVALSCPVRGLEFDEQTLHQLDSDKDAHVRPPEIIAAARWLGEVLKDPDSLIGGKDGVALANIRGDTAAGKSVLASARHVLEGLGKQGSQAITVADAAATAEFFAKARYNGDGVVPPASIDDADARLVAEQIVACLGGALDRSGALGIDQKRLDAFFAEATAFSDWWKQAETDAKSVLPLGKATVEGILAYDAVRAKVDDYFGRCKMAGYDPRAQAAVNLAETAYLEVAAKDFSITADEIKHFPLALVAADKPLPLSKGLNPAWSAKVARLRVTVLTPLLGDKSELTQAEWETVCQRLAPHKAWTAAKAGHVVEPLGIERVRAILGGGTKDKLAAAIAADLKVAPEVEAITQVEKLARLHRDFHRLLCNYVSFTDFYARRGAIFQAGRLFLDGRSLELCFHVLDPAKHATLAGMAKTYLAYVDCTRPGGDKMTVACAFTAGDSDNLFPGRNGIFYDRKGRDWNATIAKIVDNPISIGQAFWMPYKKLVRWIEEQVAKRAAAADGATGTNLQSMATSAGTAATTGAAPKPEPKKMDIGVLAAISVAISGVAGIMGLVLKEFFNLGYLMPLGILGLILLVSGPAMIIAWFKLRQRNLGPILDANGWAVNTLTKVNIPLGRSLTDLPTLPPGSERSLTDPYAPKKRRWPWVVLFLLLLGGAGWGLWHFGLVHKWWPKCPLPTSAWYEEYKKTHPEAAAPATQPTQAPKEPGK